MRDLPARPARPVLVSLGLVVGFSFAGGALLVFALNARAIVAATFLGGMAMLLIFYLSGNMRMSCLMGLIFAAPIDLSRKFMPIPHYGGEWALRIEASDLFVAALLVYWFSDFVRGRVKTIRVPNPVVWWGSMIALAVLCLPIIFYRTLASYEIIRMSKMLILAVVLTNEIVRRKQIEYASAALIAGALIQSVYGLMQRLVGLNLPLEKFGQLEQTVTEQLGIQTASRVGAMLGHPNMLAGYLIMILPLAFMMLFGKATPRYKALCLVTLLLGSATLVFTLSRAAWLGYAAGLVLCMSVTFLHPRMRYRALTLRVVVVVALAMVVLMLSGPIIEKFTLSNRSSIDARLEWLRIAWRMIRANMVTGVGLNAYTFVFDEYDPSGIPWGDMRPPVHNIYALIWCEQGIIGLLLFTAIMLSIAKLGMQNLRTRDDFLLPLSVGLWAGQCAVLVQGLADWTLRVNPVMRTFWTSVALMGAIYFADRQGRAAETEPVPRL